MAKTSKATKGRALYTRVLSKTTSLEPIVRLWALRLLVPLKQSKHFIEEFGYSDDDVAEELGLKKLSADLSNWSRQEATIELRKLHEAAERECYGAKPSPSLQTNVDRVAQLVGMSDVEARILEFLAMLHTNRTLEYVSDNAGALDVIKIAALLSTLLDLPEYKVRAALNQNAYLSKSGLIRIDLTPSRHIGLKSRLRLLSDSFADKLMGNDLDPILLIRDMVRPVGKAQLELADYDHIKPTLNVLLLYLDSAFATRRTGVNVLIYGCPGTGKSELAKVITQHLGGELFEVTSEDEADKPIDGERRFQAYKTAQAFFKQERTLIVFDEVEDVFSGGDGFFSPKSVAQKNKAWVNHTLEENPVPALWITNSIDCMDPAFIRRFDVVFELPVPPKKQREKIARLASGDVLSDAIAARIAEAEFLAPALVTRAAAVVGAIQGKLPQADLKDVVLVTEVEKEVPTSMQTDAAMELLLNNTLIAQGHQRLKKNNANALPQIYDPAFICADSDLSLVASGLAKSKSGRLCLYGPPGTGKTAYGRWLAQQLEMPLIIKRASDILGMFVGQNEKNIARAFDEAEQEGAILLIDEVDSFLQDRRGASKSWEVTSVNEMLTQMESFSGIFIASTNLMDGIDPAALRRFDLKVKFDYLLPEQAEKLLRRYCQALELPIPNEAELADFASVSNATPGDFAAVMCQHRFAPIASGKALIDAVIAECALKEGGAVKHSVGFL